MSKLFGVDVYSGEGKNILEKIKYDFAIVKVSGNPQSHAWDYVNPYAEKQAADCMKKTGLLGLYHFTCGKSDPCVEADFFIKNVKKLGYLGKAMLVIDYEAEAVRRGRSWVKKFADRITELAGYKPVIYSYSSAINEQNLGNLGYPIWCANYYKDYTEIYGYDTSGCKIGYKESIMWQFTSSGRLKGYNGNLDLNVFFGDAAEFKKYMSKGKPEPEPKPKPEPKPVKKTITEIAKEVIAGKWGHGEERKKKLKAAGYDPKKVQAKVDELLKPKKKSITTIAKEVINGKWGNGITRKKKLKKAGYDPKEVQKKVNELLRKGK